MLYLVRAQSSTGMSPDVYVQDGTMVRCMSATHDEILPFAYASCEKHARHLLEQGCTVIVVDPFAQLWELLPYYYMATEYNIPLVILPKAEFQRRMNMLIS
jgi:hypothetical protein